MEASEKSCHIITSIENGKKETWNVFRLWDLATESSGRYLDIPVSNFSLDIDIWFVDVEKPTVLNVLSHCKRVMDSDLNYPILISPSGKLLDGMHRIGKAWILGYEQIHAFQFDKMPNPDLVEYA